MKNYNNFINEKLNKINRSTRVLHEDDKDTQYRSDWAWFNNLITDVKLDQEQLEAMFWNLPNNEIEIWIKEIKDCCTGTKEENDANEISDVESLAYFYAKHPIKN